MVILGIDPGTAIVGWAVMKNAAHEPVFIAAGAIRPKTRDASLRLLEIHKSLARLIDIHSPTIIALEKVFFSKNIKTALSVAEARGVILLTAAIKKIKVCEYTPNEVKSAATGYGHADKKQVREMMRILLHIPALPRLDDITDAMAIAFTAMREKEVQTSTRNSL